MSFGSQIKISGKGSFIVSATRSSFGDEAIDTIVQEMLIVIVASVSFNSKSGDIFPQQKIREIDVIHAFNP
jgi:hypothetical protein